MCPAAQEPVLTLLIVGRWTLTSSLSSLPCWTHLTLSSLSSLSTEHVTARFGNEDSHSYAAFTVTDYLGHDLSISLFLRTRRPHGLLLALTNSSSRYLQVWLEDGRVAVQLHNSESLKAEGAIDDGEVHFVNVEVANERMTLSVAAQKQSDVEVRTVTVQAGDAVHVGGLSESGTTTPPFGGYFKGCIQDLRINDRRLQFFGLDTSVRTFPLQLMENVTAGCSGDDACSVSGQLVIAVNRQGLCLLEI